MATLARAVAVTAKVDRKSAEAMLRHPVRETLVAAGVLAKAMNDGKVDDGTGHGGALHRHEFNAGELAEHPP